MIGAWIGRWLGAWFGASRPTTPTAPPYAHGRPTMTALYAFAAVGPVLRTGAVTVATPGGALSATLLAGRPSAPTLHEGRAASPTLRADARAGTLQSVAELHPSATVGEYREITFPVQDDTRAAVDITGTSSVVVIASARGRVEIVGEIADGPAGLLVAKIEPEAWGPWLGISRPELVTIQVTLTTATGDPVVLRHGEAPLNWTIEPRI